MSTLLNDMEQYWDRRAQSYSESIWNDLGDEGETRWGNVILSHIPKGKGLKVLDIGTGPGFFAIALARRNYDVTAVDYTSAMLEKARENAAALDLRKRIMFKQMDAQSLTFADNTFDAIVTRDLTWNLEHPDVAYKEWYRVLKKGGVLLNFDAGWYEYLFDETKAEAFRQDRENVAEEGLADGNYYCEGHIMEEFAQKLILSRCRRPSADIQMLLDAGFPKISVDCEIWKTTWDHSRQVSFASTPGFMIRAQK